MFHRPTKIYIDSSDICDKAEHATIYCQYTGEVVDVCFNNSLKESLLDVQQKIREVTFCSESALTVESVDELMYKEVKPDYEFMTVLDLYAKLSKLRLTGTFGDFSYQLHVAILLYDKDDVSDTLDTVCCVNIFL